MGKNEKKIVFLTGILLLVIFTFTDLQISLAIANKPAFSKGIWRLFGGNSIYNFNPSGMWCACPV